MNPRIYGSVVLLVLAVLFGPAWGQPPASPAATPGYVVDPTWPQKPAGVIWKAMPGVTVDSRDNVYLFTRSQPAVQIYRPDGRLVRSWPTQDFKQSHFIRIGPEGNVWLTDFGSHVVQKYTPDGKLLLTLGTAGQSGCDATHLKGPTDVAVLPGGDVFVSDGYGNRRVVHFDARGRFVKQWGTEGDLPGQFALPHAIAADSKGLLYVADRNNARVQVFDQSGKLLSVWKDTITPWGIFITGSDEIWICGSSPVRNKDDHWQIAPPPDQVVMKFTPRGKVLLRVPLPMPKTPPAQPGQVDWVHALAVDSKGSLYLGDIQGKRAQKFVPRKR